MPVDPRRLEVNSKIKHLNIQTGTILKMFGKRGTGQGEFKCPIDVCLDNNGRIVLTVFGNNRIHLLSQEGETISIFGDRGFAKLDDPISCIHCRDRFLVSDSGNHCIKVFNHSGTFLCRFGNQGNGDGQFKRPYGICLDNSNNLLVCDRGNNRVQQFSLIDNRFTGKTITDLPDPTGIAIAPDGRILVTSGKANKVYILK